MNGLSKIFPILSWIKYYSKKDFADDFMASIIVTIMLVPQSMAYAMLAGLPPVVGMYASIFPLIAYALFGSSRTLAVGPVAVISLMTATAIHHAGYSTVEDQIAAALALCIMSGLFLFVLGCLRLGFLANLLSHPVISSFITASAVLIAFSQMKHILGLHTDKGNFFSTVTQLTENMGDSNMATALIGGASILFLFWARSGIKPLLIKLGLTGHIVELIARSAPLLAVFVSMMVVAQMGLDQNHQVKIIGDISGSLPPLALPHFDMIMWQKLMPSALIISVIGFVESVSVAQSLASLRREHINPDQELRALGAANLAAGLSGGYPVTGGFARSVVNFDAGARSPLAGAMTAVFIGITTLLFTPLFYYLPHAVLAATIIVAVLSLVNLRSFIHAWQYRKADGIAALLTFTLVLGIGVEAGIIAGVLSSMLLHIWHTSRPHMAVVGIVPGTEHFRNVDRHEVITSAKLITIRIDESLYFANSRYLENKINELIVDRTELEHVILMCSAVNEIDASALESLENIGDRLEASNIKLHLSEIKGPVMDRLRKTDFMEHLNGQIYLSQYDAIQELSPECCRTAKGDNIQEPDYII